ncbi:MFS transporter [Aliiglaciecola lipolytica]|uniref:MFS transporter, OPA family, sugar phosphate sensor protein UhpC n=1 Tax=Aliiglaciecola lipolytica E3 TaxID=1127673 RepID=K6WZS0_9ALTE|nr:MFS transporter [Aliiglaciecola lipolytica]GAC13914.1 MFS transporter, OPA family, sugar phosphate sensor protein UhpC [Aliiglaciecola lipolytica E3]
MRVMLQAFLNFFRSGVDQPVNPNLDYINSQYQQQRRNVIVIITVCYGLGYVCRLAFNVVKKPLMDAGVFTPEELGIIGSTLLYGYALGKFTNGFLADYAHVGRFFAAGLFLSAMANIGMSFSDLAWVSALLWGLNGWFQGFGAPASVVSMAQWYSNHERGRYYGIWSTAHSIGEGLTYLGIAWLIAAAPKGLGLDWQWGLWTPAVICIFAAFIVLRYLPDRPRALGLPTVADWKSDHAQTAKKVSAESVWKTQLKVLAIPSIWILALASSSMYVTRYAINSWGNVYLQEIRGFDLFDANLFIFFNTVAGILGCVVYGLVSDKFFDARRPPANLIFGLIELVPLWVIFYGPQDPVILAIALVVYGFGLSGILASLGGLFAVDIAPKKVAGAAMGFIGVFSYIGAGLQDYISGKLIYESEIIFSFPAQEQHFNVYFYNYDKPILFWVGASVLSIVLASSLWKIRAAD